MAVQMSCYTNMGVTALSNLFDELCPSPRIIDTAPWFSGKMDRMQAEQFLMEVYSMILFVIIITDLRKGVSLSRNQF